MSDRGVKIQQGLSASGNGPIPNVKAQRDVYLDASIPKDDMARMQGEYRVMTRIVIHCQAVMLETCAKSMVSCDFLAALTANESAGVQNAARFEPAVYRHLRDIAAGESIAYGRIHAADLDRAAEAILSVKGDDFHARYLTAAFATENRQTIAALEDDSLRQLATSWGYTQIMGYHVVGMNATVRNLIDPSFHYHLAVELLTDFARQFKLDPQRDFEQLFRCWNSGSPNGKTYDPNYVADGLRRMQLHREVVATQAKAALPTRGGVI